MIKNFNKTQKVDGDTFQLMLNVSFDIPLERVTDSTMTDGKEIVIQRLVKELMEHL
jgi:hypothetical protein